MLERNADQLHGHSQASNGSSGNGVVPSFTASGQQDAKAWIAAWRARQAGASPGAAAAAAPLVKGRPSGPSTAPKILPSEPALQLEPGFRWPWERAT